jgi:hypothetical protein
MFLGHPGIMELNNVQRAINKGSSRERTTAQKDKSFSMNKASL